MLETQKRLVEQSISYGDISWVVDEDQVLDVSGAETGGANVVVEVDDYSGFTPVVGQYVLLRNPVTGDGFVAEVEAVGAGAPYNITVDLQQTDVNRNTEDVNITSAWKVYLTAYHFPMAVFMRSQWTEVPSQAEDKYAFHVSYQFQAESDVVYKASYLPDLT
jgi:hypothetical protein